MPDMEDLPVTVARTHQSPTGLRPPSRRLALATALLALTVPGCQNGGHFCLFGYSSRPNHLGLGLLIARRAAEVHGGTFQLESQAGQFFRATLRIPVRRGE